MNPIRQVKQPKGNVLQLGNQLQAKHEFLTTKSLQIHHETRDGRSYMKIRKYIGQMVNTLDDIDALLVAIMEQKGSLKDETFLAEPTSFTESTITEDDSGKIQLVESHRVGEAEYG